MEENTSSAALRNVLLTNSLEFPCVFKNKMVTWDGVPKTKADLTTKYGDVLLDFRLVDKDTKEISWEGEAVFVKASVSQFVQWQSDQTVDSNSPFFKFNQTKYWAYSSYNYMHISFNKDILKTIDWSSFGFPEVTGKDSTFWIGSKGSYTPCHVDSYGCNLHAQVVGRKKWVLFPPEDTSFLYPTRIPYEESSIFSSVNILEPNLILHPLFKNSHPHVVILEPGDVLFVPKKWWHFVSNLEDVTASINTWIKLDSDRESRLEESVVQSLMSCFITSLEPLGETWLNPQSEFIEPSEALNFIAAALNDLKENSGRNSSITSVKSKVLKSAERTDVCSVSSSNMHSILNHVDIISVKPILFQQWFLETKMHENLDSPSSFQGNTLKKIINCFVHPDVVKVISRLLKEN